MAPSTKPCTSSHVIIWDAGGVIVDFNPHEMAEKFENGSYKAPIKALFASQDWKDYDNGDFDEATLKLKSVKHGIPSEKFDDIFLFFLQSLKPKKDTIAIIKKLYAMGYKQFYLSNGAATYLRYINSKDYFAREQFNLNELFNPDQILLSSDICISKPNPKIYFAAQEKFGLHHQHVIFIDDTLANIESAKTHIGWHGIHFTGTHSLKFELAKIGVASPIK